MKYTVDVRLGNYHQITKERALSYLANGHPVIDTIIVCTTNKLYFMQTFSKYSHHNKKKTDIFTTTIRSRGSTIYDYNEEFSHCECDATPWNDSSSDEVYFLDMA